MTSKQGAGAGGLSSGTRSGGRAGPLRRLWEDVRRTVAAENAAAAAGWTTPDRAADRRLLALVVIAAVSLLIMHYVAVGGAAHAGPLLRSIGFEELGGAVDAAFRDPRDGLFLVNMWWAAWIVFALFVLPAAFLVLSGRRLSGYGLTLGGGGHAAIYLALFALMVPLVLLAATSPGFNSYYPFFRPPPGEPLWPRFFVFELAYLAQFVAVEFFFRGVLIHAARHRFGAWAILLPLLPYMMIHFGKPAGEAVGAVIAGAVLGYLSLRTGSIVYGVLLHAGVALTMDFAALAMTGRLF